MQHKILLSALFLNLMLFTSAQINPFKKKEKAETTAADTTAPGNEQSKEKKGIGGAFQKVMSKVTKTVGNTVASMGGAVSTVDNLEQVDILASIGTNIYPKELGLVVNDFLKGEWVDHGDFTMVMLSSKNGLQFCKYAGMIRLNGKDLKHQSYGIHTGTEAPNSGSKKISFEKNGVEEGGFTVPAPAKNIKLVSVNGQKGTVNIDLTKDVTIELENFSTNPDALVRVDIVAQIIGIRSLYLVAYVKPAAKVVIPAAAFRNLETENKGMNFKNSYLAISEQYLVKTQNNTGIFKQPIDALTGSNDGMWINVTNSADLYHGFTLETKADVNGKTVELFGIKKNAAYSMPLSRAKKIAVASFSIQGTTYMYTNSTNRWTKTETTREVKIPQIPETWLDAVLEDAYQKIISVTAHVSGGQILPTATIPSAPSYATVSAGFKDEMNTSDQFLRVYRDLYPIKKLTAQSIRLNGENALLSDTKSDALLKATITMQVGVDDKGRSVIVPFLTVEMDGASNGGFRSFVGNTVFFTIDVKGPSYQIKDGKSFTKEELDKILQTDVLIEAYKKALIQMKEKEQAVPDYEAVWKLQ